MNVLNKNGFWLVAFLLCLGVNPAYSQNGRVQISGSVVSEANEALPGVNVLFKGSSQGTVTNANGSYTIDAPNANGTLVFSYIGYATKEIPIANQRVINVTLLADTKALTEVVVVGYGTQKRSDLTGAISSISAQEIKSTPVTSVDQSLQGRAAGVQVTQTSGQPGGATTIRIRGGNSITGGNEPLYVIDGVPIYNSNTELGAGAVRGAALNALSTINPNDIESIEILKDASATAIYGSRGANGVVLITTKRGKSGQSNIDFEAYVGQQQVGKKLDLLDATQYAILANEANVNAGRAPRYTEEQIQSFGKGTDWQDQIFRRAPVQNYQLTFSGGDDKTQYAVSGNYFRQDGIILNSNFERAAFRVNLDRKVTGKLKIGNSLTISNSRANIVITDGSRGQAGNNLESAVYAAQIFNPTSPVYNPDGSYVAQNPNIPIVSNPVAIAKEIDNNNRVIRLLGNVFANYTLLEGLDLRVSYGWDINLSKENFYDPRTTRSGLENRGTSTIGNAQNRMWINENILSYNRTFAEKHSLNAVLGFTMQQSSREFSTATTRNFSNDLLGYNSLGAGSTPGFPASGASRWGLLSYLARVNYSISNKYLFTLTGRVDGSSRFGENNKYGFFPSASVAWRLSEENFVQNLGVFSDLKLRTSYGLTGNQEIGQYQSLAAISSSVYVFNGTPNTGFATSRLANPALRWETTRQFDVGLDAGFLQNRLSLTADYYYKRTNDLLLNVEIPWTTGFTSGLQNLGSVQNQGLELAIQTVNVDKKFRWTTSGNIAFNRNKVLSLGAVNQINSGGRDTHIPVPYTGILRVGEPIGLFYGYVKEGLFQLGDDIAGSAQKNAKPGDTKYRDLNGDGVINETGDRTIIGRAQPDFIYGLTNTFSYAGLDLSVFLQGSHGNDILNLTLVELDLPYGLVNTSTRLLNRWTPDNPTNDIPRANADQGRPPLSSAHVEDGSFLRFRTVTLGYNFPDRWLEKVKVRKARLYVSGQNLFTLTNYSGYDPEVSRFGQDNLATGVDLAGFPIAKSYLVGLQLGF